MHCSMEFTGDLNKICCCEEIEYSDTNSNSYRDSTEYLRVLTFDNCLLEESYLVDINKSEYIFSSFYYPLKTIRLLL